MSYLQRERVVNDLNKSLLPIVGDDLNFKEAAPLLFGTVDQVRAMRSTITRKPQRRPPFFSRWPPPTNRGGGGASTASTEGAEPNPSAMAEKGHTKGGKVPSRQTRKADTRTESCTSVSHHLKANVWGYRIDPVRTSSEGNTSHSTLFCRADPINSGGGTGTPKQRSSNTDPSERVLLKPLPGSKKGWRAETSDKPESPESVCSGATLQDGRNPYLEGPDESEGLVGESGPKGRILCNPNPSVSPSVSQIQFPREVLSVLLPPIWPVVIFFFFVF